MALFCIFFAFSHFSLARDNVFKKSTAEVYLIQPRYLKNSIGIEPKELAKSIPEAISKNAKQELTINTNVLVWTVWNSVRDTDMRLNRENEKTNKKIATLQNENTNLKKDLEQKEKAILDLVRRVEKLEKNVKNQPLIKEPPRKPAKAGGYNLIRKER